MRRLPARRTTRTITTLDGLHQELRRIRSRHGLAFERGACFDGISCVAAALPGPADAAAALSLVRETRVLLERLAPVVVHAAQAMANPRSAAPLMRIGAPRWSWSSVSMERILASGQGKGWW